MEEPLNRETVLFCFAKAPGFFIMASGIKGKSGTDFPLEEEFGHEVTAFSFGKVPLFFIRIVGGVVKGAESPKRLSFLALLEKHRPSSLRQVA